MLKQPPAHFFFRLLEHENPPVITGFISDDCFGPMEDMPEKQKKDEMFKLNCRNKKHFICFKFTVLYTLKLCIVPFSLPGVWLCADLCNTFFLFTMNYDIATDTKSF